MFASSLCEGTTMSNVSRGSGYGGGSGRDDSAVSAKRYPVHATTGTAGTSSARSIRFGRSKESSGARRRRRRKQLADDRHIKRFLHLPRLQESTACQINQSRGQDGQE